MNLSKIAVLTATLTLLSPLLAHEAHVHGVGKLDIALDAQTLSLHLDSPLVNLLGFEHTASSDKDRQAAKDMTKVLRNAASMFVINAEAGCTVGSVKLVSAAVEPLLLGEAAAKAALPAEHDGHADLDADFVFQCRTPGQLKSIDVKLFQAFQGFVSIDVQLVTSKRQTAAKLTPASSKLLFP